MNIQIHPGQSYRTCHRLIVSLQWNILQSECINPTKWSILLESPELVLCTFDFTISLSMVHPPWSNSSHLKRWRAPKGKDRLPPFSGDQKARPSLYYRVFFGYLPGNDERYPPPSNFSRFFFPFPQVGYGLVRSRYLQGIIPFGPSLPLGGGAAAAAIGTGDGGWGLPNAMEEIWPGNQCGIFIIPTGAMISSINSISGWWMTHNDTSRRQINVWCFCCTLQGGVCCDEHMRLSDNKFSKN